MEPVDDMELVNPREVLIAEPWRSGASHYSNSYPAQYMLVAQHNYPYVYDAARDKYTGADNDRISMWDRTQSDRAHEMLMVMLGIRGRWTGGHESAIKSLSLEDGLRFITALYVEKIGIVMGRPWLLSEGWKQWTGWRVLVTVNRSSGYPVYSYELFRNVSGVPTYTGEMGARNVDPRPPGEYHSRKPWDKAFKDMDSKSFPGGHVMCDKEGYPIMVIGPNGELLGNY